MATYQKFHAFVEALAHAKHDLSNDTLKIYLSNATPSASADAVKSDLAEITTGVDGYTAGGNTCTLVSSGQTGGVYTLVIESPAQWVSTGTLGPFRYAVLYNDTALDNDLIAYWDYGGSVTLANNETFDAFLDEVDGVFTLE